MDLARYAELFRTESREHLARIDEELVALGAAVEAGPGRAAAGAHADPAMGPAARPHIDALFRSMHTIKGMAGAMGYSAVEQLAHGGEQALASAREQAAHVDARFVALVQEAADALAQQVDDAVEGRVARPVPQAMLARLALPTVVRPALRPLVSGPTRTRLITVALADDAPLKSVRSQVVLARLEALGRVHSTEPPISSITDRFTGVLQVLMESGHSDEHIEAAARSAGDVAHVEVRGRQARPAVREGTRQVRVDAERLDALLDLVGELVIGRDRLLRATEQVTDPEIRESVRAVAGLVRGLQEQIVQTRMVPASHVLDRFPRLVRDVAREVGKEVVFSMEGRALAVDRAMLDAIVDPIIHLLRNAVDHGIEDAPTRAAGGKPPVGRLVLRAVRDRSAVVITVEDDGRGIDRARVIAKAVQEGHLAAHHAADTISDEQLVALLAVPGFSTAEEVTTVSGRGVGIDVVASRVRALGGALSLRSTPGAGTIVSLRLPVALSIVPAMLVRVASAQYAVPSAHVIEVLEGGAGMASPESQGDAADTVVLRGDTLPIRRLRALFGEPTREGGDAQWLVLELAGRRLVCEVDALAGQQEVVVKPFAPVRGVSPLFAGATILGDGKPALIVDVRGLA